MKAFLKMIILNEKTFVRATVASVRTIDSTRTIKCANWQIIQAKKLAIMISTAVPYTLKVLCTTNSFTFCL